MKVIHLDCERCGAPLEAKRGTERIECEFCGATVMVATPAPSAAVAEELAGLREDAELRRIDDDWRVERQRLEVRQKDGSYSRPTTAGAIFAAVAFGGIGLVGFFMLRGFGRAAGTIASPPTGFSEITFTGPDGRPVDDPDFNEAIRDQFGQSGGLGTSGPGITEEVDSIFSLFSFFPLLIAGIGLFAGLVLLKKARAYTSAEAAYRERRRKVMRRSQD